MSVIDRMGLRGRMRKLQLERAGEAAIPSSLRPHTIGAPSHNAPGSGDVQARPHTMSGSSLTLKQKQLSLVAAVDGALNDSWS